ncbi:6188_t:CDS:2, partial [Paraglomus occultum]
FDYAHAIHKWKGQQYHVATAQAIVEVVVSACIIKIVSTKDEGEFPGRSQMLPPSGESYGVSQNASLIRMRNFASSEKSVCAIPEIL